MLVEDQAKAEYIFVGNRIEQQGADGVERVEPAARLVHGFADVIGWELFFEFFPVLERIVPLRVGHRTRVEPRVDHIRDAFHRAAALFASPGHFVHVRAMQVQFGQVASDLLGQVRHRADALAVLAIFTFPNGKRRTPIALTRERPVNVVFQPVAEAAVFDVIGRPVDGLIEFHHPILELAGADVPRVARVIQQGCLASPAEGIGVRNLFGPEQQPAGIQITDDERVGVLDELSAPRRDFGDERAIRQDGHQHGQVVFQRGLHVFRAEGGRHVDESRTVFGGHEVAEHHVMRGLVGRQEGEERMILLPFQFLALERVHDFHCLVAENFLHQGFGENESFLLVGRIGNPPYAALDVAFHRHVIHVGMRGHRHIAGQGPRGGRPHQQGRAGLVHQRHADEDRGVGRLVITESNFMIRKSRATARAIRHNLVALVKQVAVPEVFQDRPNRLDVIVGEGHVGRFQVNPKRDAIRQAFPILDVIERGLAAFLVELGDAIALDVLLVGEAVPLLDLDLHGQAVRIPAAAPRDVEAAHDLVTREHVFEGARQHVVNAGFAVGGGWTFVENVLGRAPPLFDGFLENILAFPHFEHRLFHARHVEFGTDWFEHSCLVL